ncbi:hypothetical protein AVEN_110706-1 [Araneus ventricosus]|uniref:Secreted protein n=1 Tax=Araneus ventricosus TaxID=182803 RepID=A0A4Y2AUN0_ARAVE|nr:hypothetical protein AVEN_110706-1 [Araneus ventricosus]
MKAGSAFVPVMAVCWLEGGQVSACNQPVCSLDTLDLHLVSWSGEQFPMTAGALLWFTHPDCKFVRQSDDSTCCAAIMNSIQEGVFQ